MTAERVFMMGEFAAHFPSARHYARNHMWAMGTNGQWKFGFTAYAVRLLQDGYFLDWTVDPETTVQEKAEIGSIESKKAESDLYAPIAGTVICLNDQLLRDPSTINVDKYGDGWLFEMAGVGDNLLSVDEYITHLDAVWEVTQRTIKGQLNE